MYVFKCIYTYIYMISGTKHGASSSETLLWAARLWRLSSTLTNCLALQWVKNIIALSDQYHSISQTHVILLICWFPKSGVPQIIHVNSFISFNGIFYHKSSILGYPPWPWKPPYGSISTSPASKNHSTPQALPGLVKDFPRSGSPCPGASGQD